MAQFRRLLVSLLLRNPNPRSRRLFSFPPPPSWGPLFLSGPSSQLSQSATPLYLRGNESIFPEDLIKIRSPPIGSSAALIAGKGARDVIGLKRELERGGGNNVHREDEKLLNLPNIISISRMVSGPFIGWMIMNEWYLPAFSGLALSGISDWLDGFVARRMNINSVFGSYLDPLADKVLIGCVALAMVERDLLDPWLVGLFVFRDVVLVCGAVYKRASILDWKWKTWSEFVNLDATHREKIEPIFISKVNTVVQLLLVAAALLQPEFGTEETQRYIMYLSCLVASTTVASSAAYGAQFLRHRC